MDQRRALVSVTPAGDQLIREVEPALLTVRLEMRALFGIDRLRALDALLEELAAALGPGEPEAD
jgi:DNA-binding MarR family transcriptional regulator